jgi:hypothetical protein
VELFLEKFALPLLMCKMSPDCREIHFRLLEHANGQPYLDRAHRVIAGLSLPLTAEIRQSKVGDMLYETRLVLKYTDQ